MIQARPVEFGAVGDVVNTAARLQSSAEEFEIVLSEDVYALVKDEAPDAEPTTPEVKGKAKPLRAFVISSAAATPRRS